MISLFLPHPNSIPTPPHSPIQKIISMVSYYRRRRSRSLIVDPSKAPLINYVRLIFLVRGRPKTTTIVRRPNRPHTSLFFRSSSIPYQSFIRRMDFFSMYNLRNDFEKKETSVLKSYKRKKKTTFANS